MSDSESVEEEEEQLGEDVVKTLRGEDRLPALIADEVVVDRILTFEEASRCLNTLGKDESGVRYAYLMISATERKLTNVAIILNFKHLLFVDVSGNYLTLAGLQVLCEMPYTVYIKAQRNRIESAALKPMPYLQVLSLSRNRIAETGDINQPMLHCLDLNYNQIYTPQFDGERTVSLKQLEMRGNQLFDLSGLFPPNLENLYLAENHIARIVESDAAKLTNLKLLHLRDNQLRKLNGFSAAMCNLKYLNLRQNKINKLRQFRKLRCLPALETLVMLQNPVSGEDKEKFGEEEAEDEDDAEGEEDKSDDPIRIGLLVLLPTLKRINKSPVTIEEREESYLVRDQKYREIMDEDSSEDEIENPTTTELTTEYTTELDLEIHGTESEEGEG